MELTGTVDVAASQDTALVVRAQAGDQDAFALVIERRAEQMLRTARAILRDEADARDATQETLVSAWVHLPRLRQPASFDGWLNRTLVNACRMRLRQRSRLQSVDIGDTTIAGSDHADASLEVTSVQAAFARLAVEDRHILLLHHLHGFALADLARQLDIPVGTAKSRLWRARKALERALEAEA